MRPECFNRGFASTKFRIPDGCALRNNNCGAWYIFDNTPGENYEAITLFLAIAVTGLCPVLGQQPQNIRHTIVAMEQGWFHGWPANNGVWVWDNEILVGFTRVEFATTSGHNIKEDAPRYSWLARSTDGGHSWTMFDPDNYVDDGLSKNQLSRAINFKDPGFALRIEGTGYHGNEDSAGAFYYSYDKGHSWQGPFALGEIAGLKRFEACELTPLTDTYGSQDGGQSWKFLSKVGDAGAHNGNPPALVRLSDGRLCAVYGNRSRKQILGRYSEDNGRSWGEVFVIRDDFYTGETGDMKDLGYPRLLQTKNGELVAIYYWASTDNKTQHIAASIWKP